MRRAARGPTLDLAADALSEDDRHRHEVAARRTRAPLCLLQRSMHRIRCGRGLHRGRRAKTAAALRMIGWDEEDAQLQAEIMTAAELCGNNQGLVKMFQPALMAPSPGASKPTVERETATSAVVNANQSPGMLAAIRAADLAISKVESAGPIAIVAAHNTSTSSGQLAFYVERMAKQGVIGIALANSPEFVAAAPGGKACFGTNPIAFGIPSSSGPLCFDMATSAIALFGVLTSKAKGELLPPNVAYGKDGGWTTDAAEALRAAPSQPSAGTRARASLSASSCSRARSPALTLTSPSP